MDNLTKRRFCPLQNTSPAYIIQGTSSQMEHSSKSEYDINVSKKSIRKYLLSVTEVKNSRPGTNRYLRILLL